MRRLFPLLAVASVSGQAGAQVLYSNGGLLNLQTGTMTQAGAPTPYSRAQWAELGHEVATNRDEYFEGYPSQSPHDWLADDFTVPAGQTWAIAGVRLWMFEQGAELPTIDAVYVAIHDRDPALGHPPAYGSREVNVLAYRTMTDTFRITNTADVPGDPICFRGTYWYEWRLQEVTAEVNVTLPAGTYWLEWSANGAEPLPVWTPALVHKPLGSGLALPGANAMQQRLPGVYGPALGEVRSFGSGG